MADFYPAQFQNPDFLGQYLRGQQGAQQAQAFPGAMQLQGQAIQGGDIDLQQKQLALQNMKMYQALVQRTLRYAIDTDRKSARRTDRRYSKWSARIRIAASISH